MTATLLLASETSMDTTSIDSEAMADTPQARPSSPSMRLTEFVTPTILALLGAQAPPQQVQVRARLARNVASETGREDYIQVRLEPRDGELWAVPVLGKSNLIYTLVNAEGVVKIDLDAGGVKAGEWVTVVLY